jgi:hypothetical protein
MLVRLLPAKCCAKWQEVVKRPVWFRLVRVKPWALYIWPGLPQLWILGSWRGLALAGLAAATLNVALLSTFAWSELVTPGVRIAVWTVLIAAWVASALFSLLYGERLETMASTAASTTGMYAEALDYYLKGDWFQAERTIAVLLSGNARDLDARLMLATLFRHTNRFEEAGKQLEILARAEDCDKWEMEIRRERQLLAEAAKEESGVAETETVDQTDDRAEQTKNAA